MPIMRFQFSLATLLVCMTVLAVVCALAVAVPVRQSFYFPDTENEGGPLPIGFFRQPIKTIEYIYPRPPTAIDISWRVAVWGTPAVAATLGTLWAIRRLKSRRENGPAVG